MSSDTQKRLDELRTKLTAIKDDESEASAKADLSAWIDCMDGEYGPLEEMIQEFKTLQR